MRENIHHNLCSCCTSMQIKKNKNPTSARIIIIIINQPAATFLGHFSWFWPVQQCAQGTRTVSWWGAGGGHSHVSPVWDDAEWGWGGLPPRSSVYPGLHCTIAWLRHLFCPSFIAIIKHIGLVAFQYHRSSDLLLMLPKLWCPATSVLLCSSHPGVLSAPRGCKHNRASVLSSHTRWKLSRAHPPSLFTHFPHISQAPPLD